MSDELVRTSAFDLILNRLGRCFRIPKFDEMLLWRGATSGAAPHGPLIVTGNFAIDNHLKSKECTNARQSQTDETK